MLHAFLVTLQRDGFEKVEKVEKVELMSDRYTDLVSVVRILFPGWSISESPEVA